MNIPKIKLSQVKIPSDPQHVKIFAQNSVPMHNPVITLEKLDENSKVGQDQPKKVNVSTTSDYPKYLGRIQGIINQWN
jgi:hypothetical protein